MAKSIENYIRDQVAEDVAPIEGWSVVIDARTGKPRPTKRGPYLQGSRSKIDDFFIPYPRPKLAEDTDWDFAVQYHPDSEYETFSQMKKRGWGEVVDSHYMDNDTTWVFENEIKGHKVQVSFRQDLRRFIDCWTSITPEFYWKYLWKGSPDALPVEARRELHNILYYVWDAK